MIELLNTKLFIPRPRKNPVSRPRLVERLNAGLEKKLTLIAAPAAFGKTTLLSEWIPQSSSLCELALTWGFSEQIQDDFLWPGSKQDQMNSYLLQRLLQFIPVLLGMTIVTFGLIRLTPGDLCQMTHGQFVPQEVIEHCRMKYGLDKPILQQFFYLFRWTLFEQFDFRSIHRVPMTSYERNRGETPGNFVTCRVQLYPSRIDCLSYRSVLQRYWLRIERQASEGL